VEATLVLGQAHAQSGADVAASEALEDGLAMAASCGAEVLAVDAALGQIEFEIRSSGGQLSRARFPLKFAEEILAKPQMRGLVRRQALLYEKRADVAFYLGGSCGEEVREDLDHTLGLRQQILDERVQRGDAVGPAQVALADAELNLANFLFDCKRLDPEAIVERFERARQRFIDHAGVEEHPVQATFEFGLGRALVAAERFEDAAIHYGVALSIYGRFAGEQSAAAADVHHAFSSLLRKQGKIDEAYAHALANLEIRERPGQSRSLTRAEALDAVGVLAQARADFEDARSWHRRGAEVLQAASSERPLTGPELDLLALMRAHEAIDLCGLQKPSDSAAAFERARAVRGQRSPTIDAQLENLGVVLAANGCGPR